MSVGKFGILALVAILVLVAFGPLTTPEPSIAAEQLSLESFSVSEGPKLDGVADEAFWKDAAPVLVELRRGANTSEIDIEIKSVYTKDMVYFVATWNDPTDSWQRQLWEMQTDGSWKRLSDPADKGGDNNKFYEDKLAMIWPITEIKGFDSDGCFVACHRSEAGDPKPYGNKFLENKGERADMWHWKGIRDLEQIHDQYLDDTPYSKETVNAGRKSDPDKSKGYVDNMTEDKKMPAFMPKTVSKDGKPGFILDSEKVPFDASLFKPGDRLPSIIIMKFETDGGDIAAGWKWVDGKWTLEFGRKLVTGSEFDVQFSDLSATYMFGVAVFENAQVRHNFHRGSVLFTFKK